VQVAGNTAGDSVQLLLTVSVDKNLYYTFWYIFVFIFLATVCRMVRPMLSDCSVLSVCDVVVLWPNGWMDQDKTWHADRPWPWPHCVRSWRHLYSAGWPSRWASATFWFSFAFNVC